MIEQSIRDWLKARAEKHWPGRVERVILAGRAPRSDPGTWVALVVVRDKPAIMEGNGPVIHVKDTAPDGNKVEMLGIHSDDLARDDLPSIRDFAIDAIVL